MSVYKPAILYDLLFQNSMELILSSFSMYKVAWSWTGGNKAYCATWGQTMTLPHLHCIVPGRINQTETNAGKQAELQIPVFV